jgi:hypothetical protein
MGDRLDGIGTPPASSLRASPPQHASDTIQLIIFILFDEFDER